MINFARKNTLFIPASVKKIGKNAFEGIATAHLHIEKGEGLEIGDEAFLLSTPGAAFNSITCDYTNDNIPVAAANSFKSDGLVSHLYLPSCDDVDAYKAATGWKDINIFSSDAWDGSSVYKIDVEVIGEQNKRPLSYYAGSIFINGTAFADTYHISCDNKVTVDFSSPCADISIDHWNDPEAKTSNYSLTLTSDTVIKLYVKETYDTYTLELRDPAFADKIKFYMRDKNAGEWVEQSVGYRNSCVEYDSVKVVILDPDRYDFFGWYTYDALADKYDSYKYYRAVDIPEKTDKLFAEVGVRKYQLYCEIEPGDDVYTDHLEFNGGNLGTYILEQIEWGAPVTIQFFGVEMGGNRYVLDYWEDKYTYTSLSEDNPYEFIMPTEDLNIRPVIKPAELFTITAKANDDALGSVKMTVDPADKDGDRIWERAPIELEAEVKGDHINFVKWNDDAGEQSTWAKRTVYAKKDFEYVAIFEKDSFDVVINLLGGVDDKIVEVKGAGRYGWGDEVTLSFTLKDDHYHFEDWGYDSHSYTETTHSFTIEKNMTIDARVNANEYTITVVANPAEGGTVTGGGKATYLTLATLKAEPNEGYEFTGWEDDGTAPAERQVLVEGDATYTAFFALKQLTVIFMVGEEKVQEDIIQYGQHVLSPAANPTKEGYTFVGWKSSISGNVLTPTEVDAETVTADVIYTAEFKAKAAAHREDGLSVGREVEVLQRLSPVDIIVLDILADRIAGQHNLVGGKESLQTLIGNTDDLSASGEHLIGQAGIGVLLLKQSRIAHLGGCLQCGGAGIAADANHYVGVEVTYNFPGQPLAFQHLVRNKQVAQRQPPLQSGNRQRLDVVACRRHFLHLHTSFGTDEQQFCVRIAFFDGASYGYGRKDVSACTSSTDYCFHGICFLCCD